MRTLTHNFILPLLFLFTYQYNNAQTPKWAVDSLRIKQYPESEFIVAFVSEQNRNKEELPKLQSQLIDLATTNLVQSIQTTITAISTINTIEMDNKLHQTFQQSSTSASNLKVTGLKSESAYDRKSKTAYAFVYAKRSDLS